jgi:diguanylate cyclase (GGDEF)-like protein
MLLDLTETERALREIDALLLLPDSGETAVPRALALMERGVWRSRRGELLDGQADLLAACQRLQQSTLVADRDLCNMHLSGHHRRMGDADEAIRLLQPLLAAAERSGAHYDASVYTYALALIHQERGNWPAARDAFAQTLQASELLHDANGIAFAEHGLARALLQSGRPALALPHARRALQVVGADVEPREILTRTVTLAEAQAQLGQPLAARATLDRVADAVRQAGNASTLAAWLGVRADVAARLGQWPEAHAALVEARRIELGLHRQQLSEQAGRLRQQFNRARDAEELTALRLRNEQGRRQRETQALAMLLALLLGGGAAALAAHKVRQARRLKLQSETDELTGLANRRALQAFAARHWGRAGRPADLAVLAIDVDHFKQVNDTHGHAAGDRVLQQLAATLGRFMRSSDRVGRIGGEEFVAVLAGAGIEQAREVAERIRAAVAARPADGGDAGPIAVTISIGLAVAEAGDASQHALLARADAALYQAKAEGRNRVCEAAGTAADQPAAVPPGAAVSACGR